MVALIDGDVVRYAVASACQSTIIDDMGDEAIVTEPEHIWKYTVDKMLISIKFNSKSDGVKVYLTGGDNFREKIAKKKGYKENRKDAVKPLLFNDISTYLIDSWGAEVVNGMEADDAMAIEQCRNIKDYRTNGTPRTIICTTDKDLRMVPGWHYGWPVGDRVGERLPYFVSELGELQPKYHTDKFLKDGSPKLKKLEGTGLTWFYCQLITGDSVDNIPGCPGAGPAKALEALYGLSDERSMYEATLALYEAKYPENALEELVEQARLLWMVRELDAEGKPVMWEPPEGEGDG